MRIRTLTPGVWRWLLVASDGAHHLPVHQPAVHAALLRRLHAAQHGVLLPPHSLHAAVHLRDLSRQQQGTGSTGSPGTTSLLFVGTAVASAYLMINIRKAAELGWEFGDPPQPVIWAGYLMWIVLMEALRRTGGWSLLLSVFPFTVYPLFAGAELARARCKGNQSTLDQTTAYHMLSTESLLGIPIQAFADVGDRVPGVRHGADDDRRRQVLHQPVVRAVRHVPRRRRQGLHLRLGPARHDVRQHRQQRADRRHHDDPDHEADRLQPLLLRAPSRPAPRPARCWRRR